MKNSPKIYPWQTVWERSFSQIELSVSVANLNRINLRQTGWNLVSIPIAGGGRGEDFYLIHAAKSPKGVLCFEKQTAKSCIHSKHKAGGGRGRIFKGSVRAKNHLMSDLFHDVILPTLPCTYYTAIQHNSVLNTITGLIFDFLQPL